MKKIFTLYFLLTFFCTNATVLDSLNTKIDNQNNDSSKFALQTELVNSYLNKDPVIAEEIARQQLKLAKTDIAKANSTINLALSLDYQYKFKEAISTYKESLNLFKKLNDSIGISRVLLNLGIVNYYKGDLDSAIYYYVKTLDITEKIGQFKITASALGNLGEIHRDLEEYDIALMYQKKSLEIDVKFNNLDGIASSYNNIGLSYRGLNEYDTALDYYKKALEIRIDKNQEDEIAINLTNIGQLFFHKGEFERSLEYNLQALEYELKTNNELGAAESNVNIGDCYYELGDFDKAVSFLEKAMITAEKLKLPELLLPTLEGLSSAYFKIGKYKDAYIANSRYAIIQDSLFKESRMEKIKELETKYHVVKSQKENEILKKENLINHLQLDKKAALEKYLFVGFSLMIIILILVFYAYRTNKKSHKKLSIRNKRIELMNNELQSKNKSITDSIVYAKRIQEAILPQPKLVKEILNDSFVLYKPKDIVSGDFYWMDKQGDEVLIAAVDCTGHGVPGAFMSIVGNNGLNRAVRENKNTSPSIILDILNEFVVNAIQQQKSEVKDGMDIALCNLNISTKIIKFSGAYNPLFLIRDKKLQIFKGDKQPIGGASRQFSEQYIQLQKGDVCYVFTDGFADQFGGGNDKKFNKKRFKETLLNVHSYPMNFQKEELERIFQEWKGKEEQLDDICVIGFKV